MNEIQFPGLNLKLKISQIAFSIGNISIYWYAIFMVSAFIIGTILFKLKDGKFGIKFSDILDLIIIMIPVSIISARIYYVLFKLEYYIQNPIQIFNLRNGGLAIYGGIIGGTICAYIFCKKKKIDLLDLLDYIVPCLALRTSNWKMGKFCKCGSIWNQNKSSLENGNNRNRKIHRSTPNIFIRIFMYIYNIYHITNKNKK